MENIKKQGGGYCSLNLSHNNPYLVIYRINDNKPILEENEIILIKANNGRLLLNSSHKYGYIRAGILDREYDPVRSSLTRDDFYELGNIVYKKIEKLEEKLK